MTDTNNNPVQTHDLEVDPLETRFSELSRAQDLDQKRVSELQETIKQAQTEIQTRTAHILTRAGRIDELKRVLNG